MNSSINQAIVIGGGMSGLIAATQLQRRGIEVTILDKGYGIGGRLASRSLKSEASVLGFFDYGMQYFAVQDEVFAAWVNDLIDQHVITQWQGKFPGLDLTSNGLTSPICRGIQSNRAIAQHLAQDLTVINQTRVETLCWQDSSWIINATDGRCFHADAVILTPPVPQTLDILSASDFAIDPVIRSRLAQIRYDPCLSLMVVLDRPSQIPSSGGIKMEGATLDWIASNYLKGISERYAITLLAGAEFSEVHWESDSEWVIATMIEAAQPWLSSGTVQTVATRLHRWKYRHPKTVFGQRSLTIEQPGPLVLAGDAFCDRRPTCQSLTLEKAFLSGHSAAHALINGVYNA